MSNIPPMMSSSPPPMSEDDFDDDLNDDHLGDCMQGEEEEEDLTGMSGKFISIEAMTSKPKEVDIFPEEQTTEVFDEKQNHSISDEQNFKKHEDQSYKNDVKEQMSKADNLQPNFENEKQAASLSNIPFKPDPVLESCIEKQYIHSRNEPPEADVENDVEQMSKAENWQPNFENEQQAASLTNISLKPEPVLESSIEKQHIAIRNKLPEADVEDYELVSKDADATPRIEGSKDVVSDEDNEKINGHHINSFDSEQAVEMSTSIEKENFDFSEPEKSVENSAAATAENGILTEYDDTLPKLNESEYSREKDQLSSNLEVKKVDKMSSPVNTFGVNPFTVENQDSDEDGGGNWADFVIPDDLKKRAGFDASDQEQSDLATSASNSKDDFNPVTIEDHPVSEEDDFGDFSDFSTPVPVPKSEVSQKLEMPTQTSNLISAILKNLQMELLQVLSEVFGAYECHDEKFGDGKLVDNVLNVDQDTVWTHLIRPLNEDEEVNSKIGTQSLDSGTKGILFTWDKSDARERILKVLRIDPRNVVFDFPNRRKISRPKNSSTIPNYASSLNSFGLLQPSKVNDESPSKSESDIESTSDINPNPQLEKPGFTQPIEFDSFAQISSAYQSNFAKGDQIAGQTLQNNSSKHAKYLTGASLLEALPKLDFMRSKVLCYPHQN